MAIGVEKIKDSGYYGVGEGQMREVLARISQKNHANGARNPRAPFRREASLETICNAPLMAGGLGIYDCSGVADGPAAAIRVRAEGAHRYTEKPLYIKALSFVACNGSGNGTARSDTVPLALALTLALRRNAAPGSGRLRLVRTD